MELGIQVEPAIGDHPDKRPEIASRVSDPVGSSCHVVRVELEDIKHRGRGVDRANLLDGFQPGALMGSDRPSKPRPNDDEVVDGPDFLTKLSEGGADFQKQSNGDGVRSKERAQLLREACYKVR